MPEKTKGDKKMYYPFFTQVLTKQGWRVIADINFRKTPILRFNPKTNSLDWNKIERIEIIKDHPPKWYANKYVSLPIDGNPPEVIHKAGVLSRGKPVKWAYLLGWVLTDAWVRRDKFVTLVQAKSKTRKKLEDALKKYGIKHSVVTRNRPNRLECCEYSLRKEESEYFLSVFPGRFPTWDILTWNKESREKLLEGIIDGDGSRREYRSSKGYSIASINDKKKEIYQALTMSLGYKTCIHCDGARVGFSKSQTVSRLNRSSIDVNKYVYQNSFNIDVPGGYFVGRIDKKISMFKAL